MSDPIQQMLAAQRMIAMTVAELRQGGTDSLCIASALFNAAGAIWRNEFPKEADRRHVIGHAAEIAITGRCQP